MVVVVVVGGIPGSEQLGIPGSEQDSFCIPATARVDPREPETKMRIQNPRPAARHQLWIWLLWMEMKSHRL